MIALAAVAVGALAMGSWWSWRWKRRVARARIALDDQGRKRVGL